jgi:hypothetical protein
MLEQAMAKLDAEMRQRELDGGDMTSLRQMKTMLAKLAMEIKTQKELFVASASMDMHKHSNPTPQVAKPMVEPHGRAPNGQAFQR